ncbi:hypothetical protein [Alloactinosynnema sp. L-07]|nr:hypothetical protein [Alloactinosynnema sp. L-07]
MSMVSSADRAATPQAPLTSLFPDKTLIDEGADPAPRRTNE